MGVDPRLPSSLSVAPVSWASLTSFARRPTRRSTERRTFVPISVTSDCRPANALAGFVVEGDQPRGRVGSSLQDRV